MNTQDTGNMGNFPYLPGVFQEKMSSLMQDLEYVRTYVRTVPVIITDESNESYYFRKYYQSVCTVVR